MDIASIVITVGGNIVTIVAGVLALMRWFKRWIERNITEPIRLVNTRIEKIGNRVSFLEGQENARPNFQSSR